MTEVNPIMVQTLAKMTGKTEEEVLKFLEKKEEKVTLTMTNPDGTPIPVSEVWIEPTSKKVTQPNVEVPKISEPKVVQDEVITEEVPLEDLTEQQVQEIEDETQFQGGMRVGSKVRVTWEPNVGKGKIKWVGRTGTILQKLSDSGVSVYLVEFPAGKIPFQRVNKKTGKLEKGYHTKKLQSWFDENNIEEVF